MIIALDMDGVLSDFDKSVSNLGMKINNKSSSEMTKDEKKEKNDMYKYLAKNGDTFWKNLPIMPRGKEIFDFVSNNFDFFILTAYTTSGKDDCIAGKKLWLKNNLNFHVNESNFVCCRSSEKKNYTTFKGNSPHVLIDDRIRNIQEFRQHGGTGIHYKESDFDLTLHILKGYAKLT